MGRGDTYLNALIGAIVTVVGSFIPFSPVLGGGVAAYLQQGTQREALRVGAISGAMASIPIAIAVAGFGLFFSFIPVMGGEGAAVGVFLLFFLFIFVIGIAYTVGLSALGGYAGWYLRAETDVEI